MNERLNTLTSRHPLAAAALLLSIGAAVWLGAGGLAAAATGDLDGSFGHHGKVVRNLGIDDEAAAVATKGGSDVVVGDVWIHNDYQVVVAKFKPDGHVDRNFAHHGHRLIAVAGNGYARDVAIQPNGKIVIAFVSDPPGAELSFGVARLRPGGKLDPSFDRDGIQTTGFGAGYSIADPEALAIQPDGRIVVAGEAVSGSYQYDLAIARYTTSGQLDPSFDGDGRQTTDVNGRDDEVGDLALDADGRIVVTGTTELGAPTYANRLLLARYDSSGQPDSSFDGDGILVSNDAREGEGVDTLGDGRVVTVGTVNDDFMVARFSENGTPDDAFSGDGVQTIDFADGADAATSVALAGSKVVVAGYATTRRRGDDFAAARLNTDGTLDHAFSKDGRRATDISGADDRALDVAIDSHGRVVLGGSATHKGGGDDDTDTALVRLR